jgi:hypothetical protein
MEEYTHMELETEEQARAYLAQVQPRATFNIYPFESGWICKEAIPPEENMTRGLGMASLIIDKQTGVVTVQSSLSMYQVAQEYAEAKRSGQPLPGRRIYPYQWEITIQRSLENTESVTYQMTAVSLDNPSEPTQAHPLVIQKDSPHYQPRDPLSRMAAAHARWKRDRNQGIWPETATTFG